MWEGSSGDSEGEAGTGAAEAAGAWARECAVGLFGADRVRVGMRMGSHREWLRLSAGAVRIVRDAINRSDSALTAQVQATHEHELRLTIVDTQNRIPLTYQFLLRPLTHQVALFLSLPTHSCLVSTDTRPSCRRTRAGGGRGEEGGGRAGRGRERGRRGSRRGQRGTEASATHRNTHVHWTH